MDHSGNKKPSHVAEPASPQLKRLAAEPPVNPEVAVAMMAARWRAQGAPEAVIADGVARAREVLRRLCVRLVAKDGQLVDGEVF